MKNVWLILGFCFPVLLSAQQVDSLLLKKIDSLVRASQNLSDKRDFDKALKINLLAEQLALEKVGRVTPSYAAACFNRAGILYLTRKYAEAEKWYLEVKEIREKTIGKEHNDYAKVLNNLGLVYEELRKYDLSEQYFLEALTLREKLFGKVNVDYSNTLYYISGLYVKLVKYKKAESLYLEVLEIRNKVLGKENTSYLATMLNLSSLYMRMSEYEKAEAICLEAKILYEKMKLETGDYASVLQNLAMANERLNKYEKVEVLYDRVLSIKKRIYGVTNASYLSALHNLGNMYYETGRYEKSEQIHLEVKAIREKELGSRSLDYTKSLNSLASIYKAMGNLKKAEQLMLEVTSIRKEILGKENLDYAMSLSSLANLYNDSKEHEKAITIHQEARAIREKILGKEDINYASSTNDLGLAYFNAGNYTTAEPLILEAQSIREKKLGKENTTYARSLSTLAYVYINTNRYEAAEANYLEVAAIRSKILGDNHPDFIFTQRDLALFYWLTNNFKAAKPYILKTEAAEKNLLLKASQHLSTEELHLYVQKFLGGLNRTFSFAHFEKDLISTCYNNILFHKGFLLSDATRLRNLALSNPAAAEKYNELKSYNRRLATEYSKPTVERKDVAELEEKANNLEKDLARSVAGFSEALQQVTWQEVQKKLKPSEAAIEFVHYQFINPRSTDSTMYAALVLRPGMKQPVFIPLFEAKQLDTLLKAQGKTRPEYINQLYALSNPKKSMYQLIWKPLEQELIGTSTVYFSPSGLLHRLNLNAIPVPTPTLAQNKNQTLADRYQLIELGSTRQLVITAPKTTVDTTSAKNTIAAQLYGSIQYEMDSSSVKVAHVDLNKNTPTIPRGIDFGLIDSTLRGGKWTYLKWTEVEINTLELILTDAGLKADVHKAYAATEESFKRTGVAKPSPRIVHLATHGFFFPDPKSTQKSENSGTNEPVFKISEHPMIRSGLILSGGNHAWQTGKPFRPGFEDGILTAYEISQMNLSNTELVVLSACETGLGDIQGNEGVYGLQRAFKIAGAKYLIMSLWQVPDFHTQELMTTFYSKWLEDKMSIPDAFRAAQKVMKDKFKEPFYWAGFVLVE